MTQLWPKTIYFPWFLLSSEKARFSSVKEFTCVQVNHHNSVGPMIAQYLKQGWQLFSYQAAGVPGNLGSNGVNHYLLFERETKRSSKSGLSNTMPDDKVML
jgi:hypothetical protein